MNKFCKLSIQQENSDQIFKFEIRKGLGFQAVCQKHDTPLEFDCRNADCGICIFKVISGAENLSTPNIREEEYLNALNAEKNERLACQTRILGDVSILIENYNPLI